MNNLFLESLGPVLRLKTDLITHVNFKKNTEFGNICGAAFWSPKCLLAPFSRCLHYPTRSGSLSTVSKTQNKISVVEYYLENVYLFYNE